MQHDIEREYKYMLDKNEFDILTVVCDELFYKRKRYTQVNHYYDTEKNTFFKRNITIRVRQKEESLKLQIKKHRITNDDYKVSDEYEQIIQEFPMFLYYPDTAEQLIYKGSLVTARSEYDFEGMGTVCLDSNLFLGICDYEVELEFKEANKTKACDLVHQWQLKKPSENGKASRFFYELIRRHSFVPNIIL